MNSILIMMAFVLAICCGGLFANRHPWVGLSCGIFGMVCIALTS